METKVSPEILEHLKDALHILDVGGAIVKQKGAIGWLRKIYTTYLFVMTPIFQILGVLDQSEENFMSELAFLCSTLWAIIITALMILQWFRSEDILLRAMSRVRERQLLIGEVDDKTQKEIAIEIKVKRIASIGLFYIIWAIVMAGMFGWLFTLNFATSQTEFNDDLAAKIPLTYPMWFPFNFKKSKMVYIICSAFTSSVYLMIGIDLAGMLALFYAFSTFGTTNLMILNSFLQTIHERASAKVKDISTREFDKRMEEEMRKCIFYLKEILSYCELVEKCYSGVLFLQTAFSSISIAGSAIILLIKSPATDGRYGCYAFIFLGCVEQTFIFCHLGNRLTEEADNVRKSLYFNKWFDGNSKFRKTMMITMIRMSKPVAITLGKFAPLGLNTFIQIMKTAYSVLALFRNRHLANQSEQ